MRAWLSVVALVVCASGVGCAGPGPYGYAQVYTPLDAESEAAHGSIPFDPSAVRRKAKQWKGRLVTAFAVVEQIQPQKGNPQRLELVVTLRTLQARNLCQDADDASCRVTVSQQSFGVLRVFLTKDQVVPKGGEHPDVIQRGSLLRVIGTVTPPEQETDELPSIDATLVRHWPLQTYVTTAQRESMRR